MKKSSLVFIVIFLLMVCVGCEDKKVSEPIAKEDKNVLHCTRVAAGQDGVSTSLNYSIYYDDLYVTKTVSIEKITSDDENLLEQYKNAYEKVFEPYQDIRYYDNTVTKNGNTVTCTTVIDYEHVNTNKILEIEGEDGNIFESDGRVKKKTLVTLYKKYGAKCS